MRHRLHRARIRMTDWWLAHPGVDWPLGPIAFGIMLIFARPIGEVPPGFLQGVASLGGMAFAAATFSHNAVTGSTAGVIEHYRDKAMAAAVMRTWVSIFLGTVGGAVLSLLALLIAPTAPTAALSLGAGALAMIAILTARSVLWIHVTIRANGLERRTDTAYVLWLKDSPDR